MNTVLFTIGFVLVFIGAGASVIDLNAGYTFSAGLLTLALGVYREDFG